jgi:hypothetical protein
MSIIPSRVKTVIIEGEGNDLSDWPVGQLPYRAEDGTIQGSGLRVLSSGSLLAPVGFSVESGSVDFGDALRLSESAGFLAFDNLVEGTRYQLLDYEVPRDGPSSKPFYFKLIQAERRVGDLNGSATITTNPLSFDYQTKLTARTNAMLFKANSVMQNVRIRISDKKSGVAVKYFPSKSAWVTGQNGATFEVGENILDFMDTSVIFQAGTDIVFDIQANSISLSGSNGIPKFAALVQEGVFIGVADENDVANLQEQITNIDEAFSGDYADLVNVPATFAPSAHTHPTSDIQGLDASLSSLSTAVQQANSGVSGLAKVAKSGSYQDLLNKPNLFSGIYADLQNKPALFDGDYNSLTNKPVIPSVTYPVTSVNSKTGDVVLTASDVGAIGVGSQIPYSSLTNAPTIPAQITKNSELINDSGYVTLLTAPVTSVNSKIGAVVLSNSDVGAAATNHTHPISDVNGLQSALDSKVSSSALAGYATTVSVNNQLANYTNTATLNNLLAGKYSNPTGNISQYIRGDGSIAAFPAIPVAQVNSDWNATSGVAQILNKPIIPTVNYPVTSVNGKLGAVVLTNVDVGAAATSHTHVITDVVGLQTSLDSKASTSALSGYATTAALSSGLATKFNTPTGTTSQYVRGDGSLGTTPVVPTNVSAFTNDSGYITGVTASQINSAIGYTPYDASNPSGYVNQAGARASVSLTTTGSGAATYNSSTGVLNIPAPVTRSYTYPTRALNTAFQISATREAMVSYSVDITVAALLLAGTSGRVYLEYADNSTMTTNLITVGSTANSIGGVLNVNNLATANLAGLIPAGKFVRLRTANVSGTPTFTFQSAQEVIL